MTPHPVPARHRLLGLAVACALAACGPDPAPRDAEGAAPPPPARAAPPAPVDPLPVDAAGRAWVDEQLRAMDLRARVAQLVFPWISGRSPGELPAEAARLRAWGAREAVGGLIVSTGTPRGMAAKLDAAQASARVPLLVISDLETGPGMRLTPGGTHMPAAMAFGAANDTALAREAGRVTAVEARAVGIHATLGPILDLQTDPANPIINVRAFSDDPERTARLATAWMRGAQGGGLLVIGKHFPGHGASSTDSHVGRVIVRADSARLHTRELVPFRRAVDAGMAGVLVGHIATVGYDGENAPPASLSPRVTRGVLREQLRFRGLVVTDALNMGGVLREHTPAEASIRALLAGADVLLQPPGPEEVIRQVVRAVESGRLPRARVDEAARRVLTAKAAAGLHRGARVDPAAVAARVGTPEHRAVAQRVADAAIVLERDRRGLLPLRRGTRALHVTYTRTGRGPGGATLQRHLAENGITAEHVRVSPATPAATFAALGRRARAAGLLLVSAEVSPIQYRSLGVEGGFAGFVRSAAASETPVVAVSLGSPYLRNAFPAVETYVMAWGPTAVTERAAARGLVGAQPFRGSNPVTIPAPR